MVLLNTGIRIGFSRKPSSGTTSSSSSSVLFSQRPQQQRCWNSGQGSRRQLEEASMWKFNPSSTSSSLSQLPIIINGKLIISLLLILLGLRVIDCDEHEFHLLKYLMNTYDPSVRPAIHYSKALSVNFSLSLHHIIDVDEKNQILTTSCWLTQMWLDNHLQWNETQFGGIKVIRLPYHRVWRPDIILYNNADPQYTSSVINTNVIVSNDGMVTWLSHGIYKSSCDINVEYFPFDIQNCTMKWASWTYDGYQVDIVQESEKGDQSNYHQNGEFDLIAFQAVRNVVIYSCCPEPYPDITYTISLKRRPMFYVFNLIIPCLLINGIALLVFFVPCDSGEKVTLGISALLSMTVFLMTIRESLPPTEKTPLISLYYGVSICIVTFASAMAVVTLNIHHRGFRGVTVPGYLRFICLKILGRILLVQGEGEVEGSSSGDREGGFTTSQLEAFRELRVQLNGLHPTMGHRLDSRSASRKYDYADSLIQRSPRFEPKFSGTSGHHGGGSGAPEASSTTALLQSSSAAGGSGSGSEFDYKFSRIASKICETIERCEMRTAEQTKHDANQLEWKKVALVCDRFLFWAFAISTAISTTLILFSSPYGPSFHNLRHNIFGLEADSGQDDYHQENTNSLITSAGTGGTSGDVFGITHETSTVAPNE